MTRSWYSRPFTLWQIYHALAQQSPIDLEPTVSATVPRSYLRLEWTHAIDGFRRVGEHGVEVLFGVAPDRFLDLDGMRFQLRHFHFHHPSEHFLGGRQFDAELHVVHQNTTDCSFAVVAIFLAVDAKIEDDEETLDMTARWQKAHETAGSFSFDPQWWLPPEPERGRRIMRYEGSLTTDPCTEAVSWIAINTPRVISPGVFQAIFGQHPQSARPIQPRNRRYVLDLTVRKK